MGHQDGQPVIPWKSGPIWGEQMHSKVRGDQGQDERGDTVELHRADKEKEKRGREAETEEMDILGTGRDRKDMVQKWAQQLRGKPSVWHSVLVEN